MSALRRPTPADIGVVETVRDAQVAVTLRAVVVELQRLAEAADARGLESIAGGIRSEQARLAGLLGRAS